MLGGKIQDFAETSKMLHNKPAQYKDEDPYLREADSLALANEPRNLEKMYTNFLGNPKKCHSPKFQSKKHSLPEDHWTLKSAAGSQDPDSKRYVSSLFEYESDGPDDLIGPSNAIVFDGPSNGLSMDSNGEFVSGHYFYYESEGRLAMEQRCLPRREPDSHHCEKQHIQTAKRSRHITNQRRDFLRKESAETANQDNVEITEDLLMQRMANRKFYKGKSTSDNGSGMSLNILEYNRSTAVMGSSASTSGVHHSSSARAAARSRRCRCRNGHTAIQYAVPGSTVMKMPHLTSRRKACVC